MKGKDSCGGFVTCSVSVLTISTSDTVGSNESDVKYAAGSDMVFAFVSPPFAFAACSIMDFVLGVSLLSAANSDIFFAAGSDIIFVPGFDIICKKNDDRKRFVGNTPNRETTLAHNQSYVLKVDGRSKESVIL